MIAEVAQHPEHDERMAETDQGIGERRRNPARHRVAGQCEQNVPDQVTAAEGKPAQGPVQQGALLQSGQVDSGHGDGHDCAAEA